MVAMTTVSKSFSNIMSRELLLLEFLELVVLLYVLFIIESVLNFLDCVVVLQKTEQQFVLLILNRVITNVEMDQVLILSLSEYTSKHSESLGIDFAIPQSQLLDRTILINHHTQLVDGVFRAQVTTAQV